jgi:hypothetical protein
MSQRIDREIRELRRAGRRLESASKEWDAAYREYLGAMSALSRKAAGRTSNQTHRQSNKTAARK